MGAVQPIASDNAAAGTVMLAVSFRKLGEGFKIIEKPVGDRLLEAVRLPDGRISAQILRVRAGIRELVWQLTSRPIQSCELAPFILTFNWSEACFKIDVNGERVADSDWPFTRSEPLIVRQRLSLAKAEDLSALNVAALVDRRNMLSRQRQWKNRTPMGAEFDFDRLHKELAALKDFLALMSRGSTYHDLSVARSLRTLLIPVRGQMGLLQRCAAHLNAAVIVYIGPKPSLRPPIVPEFALSMEISGVPLRPYSNPVDVDVWLGLPAASLRGQEYTNRDLIAVIGDTRAAHADPGWEPLVEALETMRVLSQAPNGWNMLTETVLRIGRAIALVSRGLLQSQRQVA